MVYCRQRLSGNKSAAEVFFVDELPGALAGKIKRAVLPGLLRALTEKKASGGRASERKTA